MNPGLAVLVAVTAAAADAPRQVLVQTLDLEFGPSKNGMEGVVLRDGAEENKSSTKSGQQPPIDPDDKVHLEWAERPDNSPSITLGDTDTVVGLTLDNYPRYSRAVEQSMHIPKWTVGYQDDNAKVLYNIKFADEEANIELYGALKMKNSLINVLAPVCDINQWRDWIPVCKTIEKTSLDNEDKIGTCAFVASSMDFNLFSMELYYAGEQNINSNMFIDADNGLFLLDGITIKEGEKGYVTKGKHPREDVDMQMMFVPLGQAETLAVFRMKDKVPLPEDLLAIPLQLVGPSHLPMFVPPISKQIITNLKNCVSSSSSPQLPDRFAKYSDKLQALQNNAGKTSEKNTDMVKTFNDFIKFGQKEQKYADVD